MDVKELMEASERYLFHVYNRFPVVFDHGEGMYLYDCDGKAYLDFAAGIGVSALGYGDEEFQRILCDQVKKLLHVSNLYYNTLLAPAARAVCKVTGMDRVFFTNSGAEAIEGLLKTAKKYGYMRDGHTGHEIIAMNHSFHGRTVGALSVTGNAGYRTPFGGLMEGIRFAQFNDFESVAELVNSRTIAILLEPVQGEGGVTPVSRDFLQSVYDLCRERDMLLMLDEVQCGMGRTGSMFAWQKYGIKPDVIAVAKALGCGIPVGAFLVTEQVASASLVPGDHGSTYGGNPLALAAVNASVRIITERDLPGHVAKLSPYFEEVLDQICNSFDFIETRRGMGFMQGLVLDEDVKASDVVRKALDYGLIMLTAGGNVLRFLPPLIAQKRDIDAMREILMDVLADCKK